MSMEQGQHRLREEGALEVHDSSPAILRAGKDVVEAGREDESETAATEPGAHEWQIVDDHCLSQCGSSPRSLSHADLDTGFEPQSEPHEPEVEQDSSADEALPLAIESAPSQLVEQQAETPPELGDQVAEVEDCATDAAASDTQEDSVMESGGDSSSMTKESESEQAELPDETELVEGSSTGPLLSGQSSYADVTLPSASPELSGNMTPRSPAASWSTEAQEVGVPQELVSEDASEELEALCHDLDTDLESNLSEQELLPDSGVCSIVTGYPVGSPFEEARSTAALRSSDLDIHRLAAASPAQSLAQARGSTSILSVPSSRGSHIPVDTPYETHWAQWTKKAGSTRAGKLLKHLWSTLQMYAHRLGAAVPPKLKARIQGLLQFLDAKVPASSRSKTRLLVSGLMAVSVMLAWTLSKNRSLHCALRAREEELQHHILTILDLNAKLTNAVDVPITRHCGYKSTLTLSHSIF